MHNTVDEIHKMDGDFDEHLKTYKAFLRFMTICGVVSAASLLLLYFFVAR
jgi:hypothetical protein